MSDNFENFNDVKAGDSNVASSSLYSEVYNDRELGNTAHKNNDATTGESESKINNMFGTLQIFDSDSDTGSKGTNDLDFKPGDAAVNGIQAAPSDKPADNSAATPSDQDELARLKKQAADDQANVETNDAAPPTTKAPVDQAAAEKSAEEIEDALHWYKADEFEKINKILEGKSPEEIKAIEEAFKKEHDGKTIEEYLGERWKGKHDEELKKTLDILQHAKDGPKDAPAPPSAPPENAEELKAKDAKALESIKHDPEITKEHADLEKRARETMKDPELKQFLDNMSKLEEREAAVQRQYEKEFLAKGMSPEQAHNEAEKKAHEQLEKTYQNLNKLLEKNDKAPVSQKDRVVLAQQAMQHAADPHSISQGGYNTCNAATVETRTFTKDPAEATRLITEVATTGQYTRPGKPTIKLDPQSLQRQGEAKEAPKDRQDGHRDFASQLFEVTAVNVELEKQNQSTNPPGHMRYEQHKPIAGQTPPDNGERLMDYSTNPPKEVARDPQLNTGEIADLAKEISPNNADGPVAINSVDVAKSAKELVDLEMKMYKLNGGKPVDMNDPEWAKKLKDEIDKKGDMPQEKKDEVKKHIDSLEKAHNEDKTSGIIHVHNEQEMKDTLAKLKREGKLPVIVSVDTRNEPFWSDSGAGKAGGSGAGHVVTITDYDESTGKAKMQNQWDSASSHDITAKQLFEATKIEDVKSLQETVDAAKASGHRNFNKEYELLRFKHDQGQMSDADYDREITKITIERYKQVKRGEIKDDDNYKGDSRQVVNMLKELENSDNPADKKRAEQIKKDIRQGMKDIDEGR